MGSSPDLDETYPGATVEMIQRLETYLPIRLSFSRHSWKRNLMDLNSGKVDGIVASYSHERRTYGSFPLKDGNPDPEKSLDMSSYYLYVTAGAPIQWRPETSTFTGVKKPIGTPYGYSITALLKKANVKIDEYGTARENLLKLQADRLSGAALLEFDADRILLREKNRFPAVVKLEPPLATKHYYLMISHQFHKTHPQLSAKIWDACMKIRINHREAILIRYMQMPH